MPVRNQNRHGVVGDVARRELEPMRERRSAAAMKRSPPEERRKTNGWSKL
jgi:hypothetical protein